MRDALPLFHRVGLTGVHDFDGARALQAWQILKENGELNFRVSKTIPVALLDHAIALGIRSGFGDDRLRINSVKAFADGALGPQTALMIDPYEGTTDNRGISTLDKEEMFENVRKASAAGLSSTIHAIGDKANHDVLDVYEAIRKEEGTPRLRHRIEHVQLLHPDDFNRLGQLGIIASMQPIHATSDMLIADKYWGARSAGAYAWRTQLNANARLAFGSDSPVESFNPFLGIHAAVTRRRTDGSPAARWLVPRTTPDRGRSGAWLHAGRGLCLLRGAAQGIARARQVSGPHRPRSRHLHHRSDGDCGDESARHDDRWAIRVARFLTSSRA